MAGSPSLRFFLVCGGFVAGVAVAAFATLPLLALYVTCWAAVVAAAGTVGRSVVAATCSLAVLAAAFGAARHEVVASHRAADLRSLVGTEQALRGRVVSEPVPQRQSVRYQLQVAAAPGAAVGVAGETVTVVARPFPEVARGDVLALRCRLTADERSSGGVVCLFPSDVATTAAAGGGAGRLAATRRSFVASLQRVFPEPTAGFVAGLLVGGRYGLPPSWREALSATGTAHLVALSGYNITIVAGVVLAVLAWLTVPRRWRVWLVAATLGVFVVMAGAPASAVRAAVMGMVVVLARHLGRPASARNAIAVTAVAMLAYDPTLLAADLGFQLSFLATIGVVSLSPVLEERAARLRLPAPFKEAFLMAIAAEVFVTPLILYRFGQLSLVAPVVNAVVVPLVPSIMLSGFLAGLGGFASLLLGQLLGLVAWAFGRVALGTVALAATLPFATLEFTTPGWAVAAYYLALGSWLTRRGWPAPVRPRSPF